jgi:DNA-3-methyladenine glycosylase II
VRLNLKPIPPFRLDLTAWAIRRRPHNTVDHFDGETYRRVILVDRQPVAISVKQVAPAKLPELEVVAVGPGASAKTAPAIEAIPAVARRRSPATTGVRSEL